MLCMEGLLLVVCPISERASWPRWRGALERCGVEIWRSKKVDRVIVEGGSVQGVAFVDGTHIDGSTVAIATGNGRIPGLLDPLPEEVVAPLAYTRDVSLFDFNSYYLDRPVVEGTVAIVTFNPATLSAEHFLWPLTPVAPWTTEPGKRDRRERRPRGDLRQHAGACRGDATRLDRRDHRPRRLPELAERNHLASFRLSNSVWKATEALTTGVGCDRFISGIRRVKRIS
jgi:hypothetical protein